MSKTERANAEATVAQRYQKLKDSLTERARRLFAASEALSFG
jgi:hypothetical protein